MDWFDKIKINDEITVTMLPAQHWSRRWIWGDGNTNRSLWGSFLIEYKDKKIFFACDTGPDAPNEIAVPLIVIAEFASFAFAIEPANCAFVIPVPKPPTLAGKVTVFAEISKVEFTFAPVIAPSAISAATTVPSAIFAAVIAPSAILAVVMFESVILLVVTALSCSFAVETVLSLIENNCVV